MTDLEFVRNDGLKIRVHKGNEKREREREHTSRRRAWLNLGDLHGDWSARLSKRPDSELTAPAVSLYGRHEFKCRCSVDAVAAMSLWQ